jgi:hypothetical protein
MWGHTPKLGYTYYTYYACRTRDRIAPDGHPAFICLDEDHLLSLLTDFFNTRILGPDRIQLASISMDIATQHATDKHDQQIKGVRYALADIEARQRRLFKILEENDDEEGQLYRQARQRQTELDAEHACKTAELRRLAQTAPSAGAGAIELLNDMPTGNVNLTDAPADRLRPLLDAFVIELHYNLQANKLKIQATISADSTGHVDLPADLSSLTKQLTSKAPATLVGFWDHAAGRPHPASLGPLDTTTRSRNSHVGPAQHRPWVDVRLDRGGGGWSWRGSGGFGANSSGASGRAGCDLVMADHRSPPPRVNQARAHPR